MKSFKNCPAILEAKVTKDHTILLNQMLSPRIPERQSKGPHILSLTSTPLSEPDFIALSEPDFIALSEPDITILCRSRLDAVLYGSIFHEILFFS